VLPTYAPSLCSFLFNDPPPTEIYPLSLHDALPISCGSASVAASAGAAATSVVSRSGAAAEGTDARSASLGRAASMVRGGPTLRRSEEHTSELQSLAYLVCRLLLEKKKKKK